MKYSKMLKNPQNPKKKTSYKSHRATFLMLVIVSIISILPLISAAEWDSGLSEGLVAYWSMDTSYNSTNIEDVVTGVHNASKVLGGFVYNTTDAKLGNATTWDGNDGNDIPYHVDLEPANNLTICAWMRSISDGAYRTVIARDQSAGALSYGLRKSNGNKFIFNVYTSSNKIATSTTSPSSSYIFVCGMYNKTDVSIWINGVQEAQIAETGNIDYATNPNQPPNMGYIRLLGSPAQYYLKEFDEVGFWNRSLTQAEFTQLYNGGTGITYGPSVETEISTTLISPENNTNYFSATGDTFNIIGNITGGSEGYTFDNVTYYLWNGSSEFNVTTESLSGVGFNSTLFIDNFQIGNYEWNGYTCYGNVTFKNCTWADNGNFSFQVIPFQVTSYNFTADVLETSNQQFNTVLNTLGDVTSVSARFYYNGTYYSSSPVDLGSGNYNITNFIDIPLAQTNGNKEFRWDYTFTFTGGSTLNQTGTTYTQNVSRTFLEYCNATYSTTFVNFSSFSAENPFPKINATFKSAWQWWLGSGDVMRNNSYEDITEGNNSWAFCMSPTDLTYTVSSHVETDGTGYSLNNYYLNEATLSNATNNISLYLLNDSQATRTILRVIDSSQQPQEDIIIQIQLYDVGTDTYYTISMAKTSFNGEDIAYLNWYDSLYKFIFIQNGEVVKTVSPYRISETPQIFTIEGETGFTYEKFIEMAYSLFYNNVTQNFVLTFAKPSGEVEMGCLRVIKRGATSDTEICNACETSSSATLYCNIANSGNGTFIATFYATGSYWNFGSIIETIGGTFASTIYDLLGNDDATFYALIFSGLVVFFMFINLPLGIVGALLGIVGGAALGFQVLNWGTYISLVIIGGIIIWFIKR